MYNYLYLNYYYINYIYMCFFLLETIQWPPPILHQKYKKQIDSEVHLFISTESSEFSCRKPVFFYSCLILILRIPVTHRGIFSCSIRWDFYTHSSTDDLQFRLLPSFLQHLRWFLNSSLDVWHVLCCNGYMLYATVEDLLVLPKNENLPVVTGGKGSILTCVY